MKVCSLYKIIFALYAFSLMALLSSCSNSKKSNQALLVALVGLPPKLYSVSPQKGSPAQSGPSTSKAATEVTITGENFYTIPSLNVVQFNGKSAPILYSDSGKLIVSVPDGATSGALTVSKSVGSACSGANTTSLNCVYSTFYIDCYQPYGGGYGVENLLKPNDSKSFSFTGNIQAFRAEPNTYGNTTVSLTCQSLVTLRDFSDSCGITDSVNASNPSMTFSGYTKQFFVYAPTGNCTIAVK